MICGYARHGKDTVVDILKETFGLRHESSSHIAMREFLREELESRFGLVYESEEDCYKDRVNHRAKWFDLISEFNHNDPARLCRLIYRTNDIYVGIRCVDELKAARQGGLFDLSVWVDASDRIGPEPLSSNTITRDDCDFVILNNGGLEDLSHKVKRTFFYLLKDRMPNSRIAASKRLFGMDFLTD